MKNLRLTALVSAIALASLSAAPAMATPFPTSGTVSGQINFTQSMTITCNFSATASVVGSDVHLTGLSFSGGGGASGFCGTLVNPNGGPWVVSGAASHPSSTVTIYGVGATTVLGGRCSGDIVVEVTDNPDGGHYIDIAGPQYLSGSPSDCTVNWGTLDAI